MGDRERFLRLLKNEGWDHTGWHQIRAGEGLLADRAFVLEAVREIGGMTLRLAAEALQADRALVLEAVRRSGTALAFAAETLRGDRDLVLEAVRQDGWALEYAAESFRSDRDLVLEAVRQSGLALQFAAESLCADRELVLEAVHVNGRALEFAARDLRADIEVVFEAARQSGVALSYAILPDNVLATSPLSLGWLDLALLQGNAIAGPGSRAPICTITEAALGPDDGIRVCVAVGLGGENIRSLQFPTDATLNDLARETAGFIEDSQVIHLSFPGKPRISPFDASKPLVDFI